MGKSAPSNLLHYIRNLAGLWRAEGCSDAELLTAFADRGDEAAFTALVVRHGQLVWSACRRLLGDTPDAEDAFQAAFLTLAKKAARIRREPLAPWLHKVAHQAALDARKVAQRRGQMHRRLGNEVRLRPASAEDNLDEDRALVAEELAALPENLRVPLVLYYLEGKTQAQVGKVLGVSDRAVAGRLDCGLRKLRQRLARRGVLLTAPALAALLVHVEPAAALSAQLVAKTAQVAAAFAKGASASGPAVEIASRLASQGTGAWLTGGVSALAAGAKFWAGKPRLLSALLVVAAALTGGAWLYSSRDKPETQVPAGERLELAGFAPELLPGEWEGPVVVRGRVLDDAGRPMPHARVALLAARPARGEFGRRDDLLRQGQADAGGRFALDVLPDFPLGQQGRREVKLLASAPGWALGASKVDLQPEMPPTDVRLPALGVVRGQVLDTDNRPAAGVAVHVVRVGPVGREPIQGWDVLEAGPLPWPGPAVTDDRGRFELAGLGRRQGFGLEVRDDRFARQLAILDGKSPDPDEAGLTLRLAPPQLLEGQVLAADTGRPMPHARLSIVPCQRRDDLPILYHHVDARADADGRFRVRPLPGGVFRVYACAPEGEPYLTLVQQVSWPAGTVRQELTLALPRGVSLHGRVVDADTGQPVAGALVDYLAHLTVADVPGDKSLPRPAGEGRVWTGPDGRFVVPVMAGRGRLQVHVPRGGYRMRPAETLPERDRELYAYASAHAVLPLDLPANCREHEVRLTVQRSGRLQGRVLDASGRPVPAGVLLTAGVFAHYRWTDARRFALRDGAFAVPSTDPTQTYPVVVLDAAHEHGTFATLPGRPTDPLPVLRLQSCGQAEGRLLGRDRQPLSGVPIELAALLPLSSGGRPTEVSWYPALGREGPRRTDAEGRFTLPALVPGVRYRLYAVANGSRQLAHEFAVSAGQTLPLSDGVFPAAQ